MPIIKDRDFRRKRKIPDIIKLILLAAVIFGFYIRSCWNDAKERYYKVTDAKIVTNTRVSADISFKMRNQTDQKTSQPVLIKLYTESGQEIASRVVRITLLPNSNKEYLKELKKFKRALREGEKLGKVTVEYYKPSIL